MDTHNTSNVSDDQELAKVLESMNQGGSPNLPLPSQDTPTASATNTPQDDLSFEETASTDPVASPTVDTPAPEAAPVTATSVTSASPELDAIKKHALEELRPLVDKLDLPADEKFDTLLLLIRSTDDNSLVGAAYESAKGITDEAKRAQALLDVIKEIDYFAGRTQQPS